MAAVTVYIKPYVHKLVPIAALFVSYIVASEICLHLFAVGHLYPSLIWMTNGLALAFLIVFGPELWIAVALGSLVVTIIAGSSWLITLGSVVGSTLQALAGYYFLRVLSFDPLLARMRDPLALILAAVITTTIAPTINIAIRWALAVPPDTLASLWGAWWGGEMLSVLVITSFLGRWMIHPLFRRRPWQWVEGGAAILFLCGVNIVLFWTTHTSILGVSLVYFLLMPLIWLALRVGPRGMTLGLFLMTVISLCGILYGGYVPTAMAGRELLQVEILIIMLSFIFLFFVSSEEGRKEAGIALNTHIGQLELALTKIRAEDEAKTEFLAILAHELRNPLAPVVSTLELLQQEDVPPQRMEMIRAMYGHILTIGRLLDDLLDISRISQKKFKLQKEPVDLRPLIVRSIQMVEPLMQKKRHSLSASLPDEPVWLQADPTRLEQIFTNLLNNASKYTKAGGRIELSVTKYGGELVISVRDNGIGIDPSMLKRIFEPFLQVERSTRSAGLGIGLSLTKKLVEMHRGTIEARSAGLGHGSEFVVRLPLAGGGQLAMPLPLFTNLRRRQGALRSVSTQPAHPNPRKVLIVDDNEAAAQGLEKLLTFRGHEVRLAHDGTSALAVVKAFSPDAILLDIGLPDISGYEVARQMRQQGLEQAVLVALTGYGQDEDKKKTKDAGFDYHLTKPVGIAEIEGILAKPVSAHI